MNGSQFRRSWFRCILAVGMLTTATGLASCDDGLTDVEYVNRAREYQEAGNIRASVVELKNALQRNPANAEAHLLLGLSHLKLGNGADAEKEYRRALALGADSVAVPLAKALLQQGKAEVLLDDVLITDSLPSNTKAELGVLRGRAHLAVGHPVEAQVEFQQVFDVAPESKAASMARALSGYSNRELEKTRTALDDALARDPTYADAWSLLGDLEMDEGNFEAAQEAFGKATELRGYESLERVKKAYASIQLQDFSRAEQDVQILAEAGVKHFLLSHITGIVHFHNERYDEAQIAFQESVDLNTAYLPAKAYLAVTYYTLGQSEQALRHAEQLRSLLPKLALASRLLGEVHIQRSEFEEAEAILRESLAQRPDDDRTLGLLGTIALVQGDTAEGIDYFQRVASINPESRDSQRMLQIAKLLEGQKIAQTPTLSGTAEIPDQDYEERLLHALSQFQRGEFQDALASANKLYEDHPERVDSINLMAASYIALGNSTSARKALNDALAIEPLNSSATVNLAKLEQLSGDVDSASDRLETFLTEKLGNSKAAIMLANIESQRGNESKAIQILETAREANENDSDLPALLAQRYYSAGRYDDVLALTREVDDDLARKQPVLLELRGKIKLQSGDSRAAERSFSRWVAATPESAAARFYHAESLARSGKGGEARPELERAIELDSGYLPARLGEIKMLAALGDMDAAIDAMVKVEEQFGDRREVLGTHGWLALMRRDYGVAAESFSAARDKGADSELTLHLAVALWGQQRYDDAVEMMQAWVSEHPNDFAVYQMLARALLTLNRTDEARVTYAKVVELAPNHVPSLNNLAWLSRGHDSTQAIEYAERAYALESENPQVTDTLAMLLVETGEVSRGLALLRKAAKTAPEDSEIQLHLGRVLIKERLSEEARGILDTVISQNPESEFADEARALLNSM